jgi:ATP-dependent Lhr-like helicase
MKTGDTGPVSAVSPPTVLITTPESVDSLLTRSPRLFIPLKAIVLDEIHLFDNGPRGDQIRCLLPRLERIRTFANPEQPAAQRVALSATVPDPAGIASRYLEKAAIIEVSGGRNFETFRFSMHGLTDLVSVLATRTARKILIFCNTRNEVEQVGAFLRKNTPYEASVFVHYSNLDRAMRQEIETDFAQAAVAICVSSSTLELGIDIGSIDEVVLIGPPPTPSSFLQRIGRGGRRAEKTSVICLARSPLEQVRFEALMGLCLEEVRLEIPPPAYHFRPSVLIQQIFSFLKQSPTGGIKTADLRRIAPNSVQDETLDRILKELVFREYLRIGKPGEWRPGPELDELADRHEIYSNIGGDFLGATMIDAYTGRTIAQTERPRIKGETLLMGGRAVQVVWQDRNLFGVQRGHREEVEEILRFQTTPFAVPLEIAQAVAVQAGFGAGQMPYIPEPDGRWLFHFWGDLYGELLAAVLQAHFPAGEAEPRVRVWNEYCLHLPFSLDKLPGWDEAVVVQELQLLGNRVEPFLELGRFQNLLHPQVVNQALLEHCDLPRFQTLYQKAKLFLPSNGRRERLLNLL